MPEHHPTVLEFSLRLYFSKTHTAALEYLSVEFGIRCQRIIEDALRLYQFGEEADRRGSIIWTSMSQVLYTERQKSSMLSLTAMKQFAWKLLCEKSGGIAAYPTTYTVSQIDDRGKLFWIGDGGEAYERDIVRRIGLMLGLIYLLYLEYKSGGYARSFVLDSSARLQTIDIARYLGIYNTCPVI